MPVIMWDGDHVTRVGQREYSLYLDKHATCDYLRLYPVFGSDYDRSFMNIFSFSFLAFAFSAVFNTFDKTLSTKSLTFGFSYLACEAHVIPAPQLRYPVREAQTLLEGLGPSEMAS